MTGSDPTQDTSIAREVTDNGICYLTFDREGSSVNVLDEATFSALEEQLTFLEGTTAVRGVVLATAKPAVFLAGADLHALHHLLPSPGEPCPEALQRYVERGQAVFQRLADLPMPTVAAIHGACLGGGLELALACRFRLASEHRATRIGLPEVQLGILPAWGGCYRLPRVIGLPQALEIILNGRTLPSRSAKRYGIVNAAVPKDRLLHAASRFIEEGRHTGQTRGQRLQRLLTNNPPVAQLVYWWTGRTVRKRTRGHYPAVETALRVVVATVSRSAQKAFAREREALARLVATPECGELIRLYFLREKARKRTIAEYEGHPIKRTAVIGCGVMGSGIAQWLSARGYPVVFRDVEPKRVAEGLRRVRALFEQGRKRELFSEREVRDGMDRIYPTSEEPPLTQTDIVIEAASEELETKKKIFRRLAEQTRPDTLLATNTSALSVDLISEASGSPERVVGLHFFNPVHRMELVEVVAGSRTNQGSLQTALAFVQEIGKLPVVVRDSPGFLVNRILTPYLLEAGRLVDRGWAVEAVDEAMLDFGMPMGPLRLLDEVGLDIGMHVVDTLSKAFDHFGEVPKLLHRMVDAGWTGRKGGIGFYSYQGKRSKINPAVTAYRSGSGGASTDISLADRLVLPLIQEAARCLEEGVADEAETIDFSMVMGIGFAPFRGGPLRSADRSGLQRLLDLAERLVAQGEPQHAPCSLLKEMAAKGRPFYSPNPQEVPRNKIEAF